MNKVSLASTYLGTVAIFVVTSMTLVDVIGRYLFNSPLAGTVELVELMLSIIAGCGIAATTAVDGHIKVDSLYEKLSASGKRLLRFFAELLTFVVFSVLFWEGILAFRDSITPNLEMTVSVPAFVTFPSRLILALGFFFSAVISAYVLVQLLRSATDSTREGTN